MKRPTKRLRIGKDEELEQTLFLWFKQKREDGIPISGPILQTKAWDIFKKLHPESSEQFAASNGWLWRFCQCHGIMQLSLQGEKLSADHQAAEEFIPKFRKFIVTPSVKCLTVMSLVYITNFYLKNLLLHNLKSLLMGEKHKKNG